MDKGEFTVFVEEMTGEIIKTYMPKSKLSERRKEWSETVKDEEAIVKKIIEYLKNQDFTMTFGRGLRTLIQIQAENGIALY